MQTPLDTWLMQHVELNVVDLTCFSSSSEDVESEDNQCFSDEEREGVNFIDLTKRDSSCSNNVDKFVSTLVCTSPIPTYTHVERMIFIDKSNYNNCEDETKCDCKVLCLDNCINYLMGVECSMYNCTVGYECGNRWMDLPRPKVEIVYDDELKYGLRAGETISKGKVVIEYVGEFMRRETYQTRAGLERDNCTYAFDTGDGYIIDARYFGNCARFINHDCRPNFIAMKRVVDCTRIFLVANRNIAAHEVLSFDYGEYVFNCLCQECKNCRATRSLKK